MGGITRGGVVEGGFTWKFGSRQPSLPGHESRLCASQRPSGQWQMQPECGGPRVQARPPCAWRRRQRGRRVLRGPSVVWRAGWRVRWSQRARHPSVPRSRWPQVLFSHPGTRRRPPGMRQPRWRPDGRGQRSRAWPASTTSRQTSLVSPSANTSANGRMSHGCRTTFRSHIRARAEGWIATLVAGAALPPWRRTDPPSGARLYRCSRRTWGV